MINRQYLDLFADEAQSIKTANSILQDGCVVLPGFFDEETTNNLLNYSRSLRDDNRFSIARQSGTPAMNIARSPEFMSVFDAIHRARCAIQNVAYTPLDPTQQAVSLPIAVAGTTEDPVPFHFDASYLNAVFAIRMPPGHGSGNLLVYNNLRGRIKPLILSKVIARLLRHSSLLRKIFPPKEISYQQGALHIFFGDLTLHGVRPFADGERITYTINASRIVQPPKDA